MSSCDGAETSWQAVREGKPAKSYTVAAARPTSFKAFSEKGRDGEGAVARQRNSSMQRDANKPEFIDFKQGGTQF